MSTKNEKLTFWRERYEKNAAAYSGELSRIDERESLYAGSNTIYTPQGSAASKDATHVRNIVAELIEAQVDSAVPYPKVTARREKDEPLAKLIEDMLRNEINRLDFASQNDLQERTALIQGGSLFLCEWNNAGGRKKGGELAVTPVHPREMVPQDGVTSSVEDMDYFFITTPQSRSVLKRKYGKDIPGDENDERVIQYFAYYRNDEGGIGMFSWADDVILADYEDYQARLSYSCAVCGTPGYEKCAVCSSVRFKADREEYEILTEDIVRSDGSVIPAKTKIPYYRPKLFPLILRKNVSVYGKLFGDSDADKVRDQQNTMKKLSTKINEKLLKGGSYVTLPAGLSVDKTDGELKIIHLENAAQKQMIDVINVQPNIGGDMAYYQSIYEEARQIIGVTDSFMGRRDPTALSGAAKEFAAGQSAGRFESKRVMKRAAYAALYEMMFLFALAYSDEPQPVVSLNATGGREYRTFNRYDFLQTDENGEFFWNDGFLFSADVSIPLASSREALWRETAVNYEKGAFGDTTDIKTRILFWAKLEMLHYPGAADTKTALEKELNETLSAAAESVLPAQ